MKNHNKTYTVRLSATTQVVTDIYVSAVSLEDAENIAMMKFREQKQQLDWLHCGSELTDPHIHQIW